jgi:hypothetical protein
MRPLQHPPLPQIRESVEFLPMYQEDDNRWDIVHGSTLPSVQHDLQNDFNVAISNLQDYEVLNPVSRSESQQGADDQPPGKTNSRSPNFSLLSNQPHEVGVT